MPRTGSAGERGPVVTLDAQGGLSWVRRPGRNVEAYAYSEAESRLYVVFQSGHEGYYSRISSTVFADFECAESKGSFVAQRLKDNPSYPWTATRQPVSAPSIRSSNRSSGTKIKFRCWSCGAERTLPTDTSPMPKHKPKGSRRTSSDCVGSGQVGSFQGYVW